MKLTSTLAASLLWGSSMAGPLAAEEKSRLTPAVVEQLDLASRLTNYGLSRQDPILLLAAARILTTVEVNGAPAAPPMGAPELVEKAKTLATGNAEVAALAEQIADEATRGLCYGSGTVYGCF